MLLFFSHGSQIGKSAFWPSPSLRKSSYSQCSSPLTLGLCSNTLFNITTFFRCPKNSPKNCLYTFPFRFFHIKTALKHVKNASKPEFCACRTELCSFLAESFQHFLPCRKVLSTSFNMLLGSFGKVYFLKKALQYKKITSYLPVRRLPITRYFLLVM